MSTLYIDASHGMAGDMLTAAFLDAGMPFQILQKEVEGLNISHCSLKIKNASQKIQGKQFFVQIDADLQEGSYAALRRCLEQSRIQPAIKKRALLLFDTLAKAEAHTEYNCGDGHADLLIDLVGVACGIDYFGCEKIFAAPVPSVPRSFHPVTLKLLKGIPLEKPPVQAELITPTGAAVLKTIVDHFGECPLQRIDAVGIGLGSRSYGGFQSHVKVLIGEGFPVVVIEATIDDMNPQVYDYLFERLLEAGAVEVTLQPVQAKKNRPAILLSCQAPWAKKDAISDLILRETTTFGVRYYPVERKVLLRELQTIIVKGKKVRIKVGKDQHGRILKRIPEYEDVKRLAKQLKKPLLQVYRELTKTT